MAEEISDINELTPLEKGAIILAITDAELAGEIVAELTPTELRNLISAFEKIKNVKKEIINIIRKIDDKKTDSYLSFDCRHTLC